MNRKLVVAAAIALVIVVGVGIAWAKYGANHVSIGDSALPTSGQAATENKEVSGTFPFSIGNVRVEKNVVTIDDGDPQTNDNTFLVTWNTTESVPTNHTRTNLVFQVVDEEGKVVVDYLRGGGPSFKDERATLLMPPLCSTSPVESCMDVERIDSSKKYRLEVLASICDDENRNPVYCDEDLTRRAIPAYSNWFSIAAPIQ